MKNYFQQKAVKKAFVPTSFVGFRRMQNVVAIGKWPEDKSDMETLQKAFREEGISLHSFFYTPKLEKEENTGIQKVFTKKDLNWLSIPRKGFAKSFLETKGDVFIDISKKENPVPIVFSQIVAIPFKVGHRNENQVYDLVITTKETNFAAWIKQMLHYLKFINDESK